MLYPRITNVMGGNIAKGISDVVWSNNFFNGVVRDELLKKSNVVIRGIFSGNFF